MAKRKTLQQLCDDRYDDPDIAQAVADDAIAQGTADRIVGGELSLPSEADAITWHQRKTGVLGLTDDQRAQEDRIAALEARLRDLEGGGK